MRLRILRRHIDQAKKIRYTGVLSKSCPIALALREKGFAKASVGLATWGDESKDVHGILKSDAYQFVADYDANRDVHP